MVFNSVVENNNYRAITVDECRGFVIVNPYAPFMFVNAADGKAAQMFTITHELAHVWIGKSAGFDNDKLLPANDPIEILCDQVAAEFLVPETVFLRLSLRFAAHVNQAVKTKQLLYRDAYKLTGLKGDTYQNYINKNL